jgi:leucyl aminopeptidase
LSGQKFKGDAGGFAIIPDSDGFAVVAGVAELETLSSWCLGKLGESLPGGTYRLVPAAPGSGRGFVGWALGNIAMTAIARTAMAKRRASC